MTESSQSNYRYEKTIYKIDGKYATIITDGPTDDGPETVAKKILNKETNNTKYYVKSTHGKLYNPNEKVLGVSIDKMLLVSKQVFDNYVKFLNTKSLSYLRIAERNLL